MDVDGRIPLYVRIPAPTAERLAAYVRSTGRAKQTVVADLIEATLSDTTKAAPGADPSDVLTLDEVADLLRVRPDDVLDRASDGGFPLRRFGDEWRCSRDALLRWMEGTDRPQRGAVGFARPDQD